MMSASYEPDSNHVRVCIRMALRNCRERMNERFLDGDVLNRVTQLRSFYRVIKNWDAQMLPECVLGTIDRVYAEVFLRDKKKFERGVAKKVMFKILQDCLNDVMKKGERKYLVRFTERLIAEL